MMMSMMFMISASLFYLMLSSISLLTSGQKGGMDAERIVCNFTIKTEFLKMVPSVLEIVLFKYLVAFKMLSESNQTFWLVRVQ
jgi:hypothetical protein